MTARSKVLGDETICGEESLGLPWGFEPLHAPFPLARGLVRVFRAVVEIAMLAMFHTRENLPLRSAVASEFIRDDHPRHVRQALKELAEELLRGPLVPPATELIRVLLPKLAAPLADGLIRDDDPTAEQQLFDVPIAEAEAVIQPYAMTDDLGREAVVCV
jgi:hypothetical protein